MNIYHCDNCGLYFSEENIKIKKVNLEILYGVGNLFPDHHYEELGFCPNCESEDYYEMTEEEIIEELNKK